jgi:hypothetical protein
MAQALARRATFPLICALLIPAIAPAQARPQATLTGLGPTSKTTLIVATLTGAAALIGVGVYFAIRHGHTVKGCAADGPNGLELHTQDRQSLLLLGATTDIKAGHLIKVTGSRKMKVSGVSDRTSYIVDKLDKDYGACTVEPPN